VLALHALHAEWLQRWPDDGSSAGRSLRLCLLLRLSMRQEGMADKTSCWRGARTWFNNLRSRGTNQKAIEGFEVWRKQAASVPADVISADEMEAHAFRQRIQAATAQPGHSLSVKLLPIQYQDLLSSVVSGLADVVVGGDLTTTLSIRGSTFRSLTLTRVGTISLENCKIGRLGAQGTNPKYQIKNCMESST
jgi:hypothetical protein